MICVRKHNGNTCLWTKSCYIFLLSKTLLLPVVKINKHRFCSFFSCFHGTLPIAIVEGRCKWLILFSTVVTHLNYVHTKYTHVCIYTYILTYKSALIFWIHLTVFAYTGVSSKTVQLKSFIWDLQKLCF